MLRILWNSKSAMTANQNKLDAISNDLANSTTSGYKSKIVSFQDLVSETLNRKGYPVTENGKRVKDPYTGSGVKSTDWMMSTVQGSMVKSDLSTNLALDGPGYFEVTTSSGEKAYTRNGEFLLDANGQLVDHDGNKVTIEYANGYNANNVKLTDDNFHVTEDGSITLNGSNKIIGRIPVYNTTGSEAMIPSGDSLFKPDNGVNMFQTNGTDVLQGYTEASNVNVGKTMSDLIVTQRAFQLGSKGIQTADSMWQMVNNLRSR
ncbi:flagellar hook-basal body complex protein [Clostridium oryzae]|uniref:Flagellar basal-body rod protein FlgG n=1 Tax=Clostridium oryzae TaxID=1450648 RepID=A0A1V4ITJ8_9CLOT|nr:flagellar hook-basal body complex protein [Clostridium oryzae]OPJ63256.1 flagellar basal-body rod protein FlgG [Clostridium oryzae]